MNSQSVGHGVFVLSGEVLVSAPHALAEKPTAGIRLSEDYYKSAKHIYWGENDDFPLLLQKDLNSDTVLKPGIRLKSELYYAGGLIYGKKVLEGDRVVGWDRCYNQEIEDFIGDSFLSLQYYQIFLDLTKLQIAFPQLCLSIDGKKITRMTAEFTKAAHCRLSRVGSNGYPETLFVNPDFGTNDWKETNNKTLPCAPLFATEDWIKNKVGAGKNFAMPIVIPDGVNIYYPDPDWNSARNSNWVQISKDIAVFNKALVNNKLTILYHIEVHPEYWPSLFGEKEWTAKSADEKVAAIKTWATAMSNNLKGAENVGNVFVTNQGISNGNPEKTYSLVKITKVDREIDFKEGAYIPTSKEASEHKTFALGLHSDITGVTPGGGMGAGSGSNSRVAFNQRAMLAKAVQDIALQPLRLISRYNKWPKEYEFTFETSLITTLDAGAETMKATHVANPQKTEATK